MIKNQIKILKHTQERVGEIFKSYPVTAHGIDHVLRVKKWIEKIAEAENGNVFLASMAALLHDIGRTREKGNSLRQHHELSYEMCREWFKNDSVFDELSERKKIEILYAVRYHWNEAADKYKTAIFLRDADKLDILGKIGLKRTVDFHQDEELLLNALRFIPGFVYHLKTMTAKNIVKEKKLIEPLMKLNYKLLKSKIEPIEI